jgi:hypothetical protein
MLRDNPTCDQNLVSQLYLRRRLPNLVSQEATTKSDAAAKKDARANRPGMKTKAVPAPAASPPKKNKRGRSKETIKTPDSL